MSLEIGISAYGAKKYNRDRMFFLYYSASGLISSSGSYNDRHFTTVFLWIMSYTAFPFLNEQPFVDLKAKDAQQTQKLYRSGPETNGSCREIVQQNRQIIPTFYFLREDQQHHFTIESHTQSQASRFGFSNAWGKSVSKVTRKRPEEWSLHREENYIITCTRM